MPWLHIKVLLTCCICILLCRALAAMVQQQQAAMASTHRYLATIPTASRQLPQTLSQEQQVLQAVVLQLVTMMPQQQLQHPTMAQPMAAMVLRQELGKTMLPTCMPVLMVSSRRLPQASSRHMTTASTTTSTTKAMVSTTARAGSKQLTQVQKGPPAAWSYS